MPSPRPLPASDKDAFALPGAEAHALLLHGFTSTPYELRTVGEALSAAGVAVVAPLLPGHGTRPEDLSRVRAEEWVCAAEQAFDQLDASKPRIVVGASMGGLLGLLLARRSRAIRALVLLAPALRAQPAGRIAMMLAPVGLERVLEAVPKSEPGGDIECAEGRAKNPCYPTLPVAGVAQLERLRRMTWPALGEVRAPLCVFHGARDRTIDPASSEVVARAVKSPWVERHLLPRSRHVLGLDVERDIICEVTVRFVREAISLGAAA